MESTTILSVIGGAITLSIILLRWIIQKNDARIKKEEYEKKRISDAIASGDVSRIHDVIDGMRS